MNVETRPEVGVKSLTLLQPEKPPVDAGSRQPSRGVLRSHATAIGTPDGFRDPL